LYPPVGGRSGEGASVLEVSQDLPDIVEGN